MPLIHINLRAGKPEAYRQAIFDGLYRAMREALNVPEDVDVLFLLSVPNTLKMMLLNAARLLVYTPANEHFGIVPLEAMLAGVCYHTFFMYYDL